MNKKILAGVLAFGLGAITAGAKTPVTPKLASVVAFNLTKANASMIRLDEKVVEYIVNPGGTPSDIELEFQGVSRLLLDISGHLTMSMDNGEFRTYNATFYQMVNGKKKLVSGNFRVLSANRAAFHVGKYDASLPLQIDARVQANPGYRG